MELFPRLEKLLLEVDVEVLNESLRVNNQMYNHETVEAAATEIVNCIRNNSNRVLLDTFASHLPQLAVGVKLRAQRKILNGYLKANGLRSLIQSIGDENLRLLCRMVGWQATHLHMEIKVVSLTFQQFLSAMATDDVREWCAKGSLSQSGDQTDLIDTLTEAFFPRPTSQSQSI